MDAQRKPAGREINAQKKGRLTARLVREIMDAAKLGGPDPDLNPRLLVACENARNASVSRDTIERAIKKGASEFPKGAVSPADGLGGRRAVFGVCLFLAVITFVVFGQTLRHEFVNYDDGRYVADNPAVLGGLSLKGIVWAFTHAVNVNWTPLTVLSHMLDCQLYGTHAGGHHLTNVLLHLASAIVLFLVMRGMTGALWRSAFVAALFAIHPLHVESVAWIAERRDVLSGLFFMLTLGAYARYAQRRSRVEGRESKAPAAALNLRLWTLDYYLVLLLFALALLSKPMVVTLPLVLLLLDYWPLKRFPQGDGHGIPWRLMVEKIPLLMLSGVICVATLFTQQEVIQPVPVTLRLGNALVSYLAYMRQMIWPAGLAVFYPYPSHLTIWTVGLSLLILTLISAGVMAGWRKYPYLAAGWCWYLIMLVPVIGLIQSGLRARADRYTYLPEIGLYILMTWLVVEVCSGWRNRRLILGCGAVIILGALTWCARVQTAWWQNSESLWTHTLACTSDNATAHINLGDALLRKGDVDEAIAHFQTALQIEPDDAQAHINLGNALIKNGDVDEAIVQYNKALQIKPDYVEAHINLGGALIRKGDMDDAIAHFQTALQIDPDNTEAHNNLGNILLQKGDVDDAIIHYQKALQINPDNTEAQNGLGLAMFQKGRVDDAIIHFQKALQINPNNAEAWYNLGDALLQKGRVDDAIDCYQKALQIRPDNAEGCYKLGSILLQRGRTSQAIAYYQAALQIKPDYVEVLNNLALVLAAGPQASLRNGSKAVELAQRASQITAGRNPAVLGTLAAAYAEAGRFPEAVATAQRAVQLAEMQSNLALASTLQSHLKLYQAGSPFHMSPTGGSPRQ